MATPLSIVALIMFHLSADSRTFTLVVKESVVSPPAKWFAPLVIFAGLSTGLLLSSNYSELSPMISNTWYWWLILLLKLEKIVWSSS
jgi:hypothetical protein